MSRKSKIIYSLIIIFLTPTITDLGVYFLIEIKNGVSVFASEPKEIDIKSLLIKLLKTLTDVNSNKVLLRDLLESKTFSELNFSREEVLEGLNDLKNSNYIVIDINNPNGMINEDSEVILTKDFKDKFK